MVPDDPAALAKAALHAFVTEAVGNPQARQHPIDTHRHHTPLFNPGYDDQFKALPKFSSTVASVQALPAVREYYGVDDAGRLVLQFLYTYFDLIPQFALDEPSYESVWDLFQRELETPYWRHIAVAVLQNLSADLGRFEISDGVAVCMRTLEFARGAIGQMELNWLIDDCRAGAIGTHALLAEHREPKRPDNACRHNAFQPFMKFQLALRALRLVKDGDLQTGRIFYSRPALFPKRLSGQSSSGRESSWRPGREYRLTVDDLPDVSSIYGLLGRFQEAHINAWKNLDIALRRFDAAYENDWNQAADRVIDAVIALEALLGTDQEITYKLSTRIAGILARDDDERVALFKEMRVYYDTRSKIVHGGDLKEKHLQVLRDLSPLMQTLRRLLVGFLRLADGNSRFNLRKLLAEEIDSILLHSAEREELRRAMEI
jgi:hypothetical protein